MSRGQLAGPQGSWARLLRRSTSAQLCNPGKGTARPPALRPSSGKPRSRPKAQSKPSSPSPTYHRRCGVLFEGHVLGAEARILHKHAAAHVG